MKPFLAAFDIVPGWVYAAALAASLVMLWGSAGQVARLERDLARAAAAAAKLEADQKQALLDHANEKLALIGQHNAAVAAAEKTYAEKLAAAEVRARSDAAVVGRLRNQIAEYARRGGTCKPAAPVPDGGKSAAEVLGGLLAESLELLEEGRRLNELRDAEMSLLFEQIDADRAACGGKRAAPPLFVTRSGQTGR